MEYRALGRTGLTVSVVGFGGWGIGGPTPGADSYGVRSDAENLAALGKAFDCGITFYDTAAAYGAGHSESLIGRAFHGSNRDQVVIATKAGVERFGEAPDWRPGALRASVEASLARLDTDRIDLLQLHNPPTALLRERPEILAALDKLRAAGKIRAWGLSLKSPLEGNDALRSLDAPVLQVNLNLLDQRAVECGLLDLAQSMGAGIIARTPLAFGYLSGMLVAGSCFPPGDHRNRWSLPQRRLWLDGAAAFADLTAAEESQGIACAALRFAYSHSAVASTVVGILTPAEAAANATAGGRGGLSIDLRRPAYALYRSRNFFAA